MPPEKGQEGEPQNKETFTKEQVQQMISEAVTKANEETEAKFKKHIEDLNKENASRRIDLKDSKELKKILSETLGLSEKEVKETDLLNAKITEIVNKNQELETKFNEAVQKAAKLEKQAQVAKFAKELGLKDKAVGLVQLDAENLEEAVKKVAEDYPELKVNYQVGGGSNPANLNNSSMPNPYKKETFNLSRQAMLEAQNPSQAAKFKAEQFFQNILC